MLIGLLSDTHIPGRGKTLPGKIFTAFEKVDLILHAGDIVNPIVIEELECLAPVKAVTGNMDNLEIAKKYPKKQVIEVNGFKIGLIHGDGIRGTTAERAVEAFSKEKVDCIVFGHSHQAFQSLVGDLLLINPGSPTDKRRSKYYSFGFLEVTDKIEARIVYFK